MGHASNSRVEIARDRYHALRATSRTLHGSPCHARHHTHLGTQADVDVIVTDSLTFVYLLTDHL